MRSLRSRLRFAPLLVATGLALGCAPLSEFVGRLGATPPPSARASADVAVYERAQHERSEYFEREVERLRADLRQAEESIVALESGLRDVHSRADAVSAVAEARIAFEGLSRSVPWRADRVAEARTKLDEAGRQLDAGNVGAAVFFASRARRITDSLHAEARQVALWKERRRVGSKRVNLRAGPSPKFRIVDVLSESTPVYPERTTQRWTLVRTPDGRVGWVHASLLRR